MKIKNKIHKKTLAVKIKLLLIIIQL